MSLENQTPAQDSTTAADNSKVTTEQAAPVTTEKPVESVVAESAKPETDASKPEATTVAPQKYDIKLPEGSILQPGKIEEISLYAKEKGLTNDQAQEVLNRDSDTVSKFHEAQLKAYEAMTEQWRAEAAKDKEIGGEALPQHLEGAKRVVERFAPEGFMQELDSTGYGNHPLLIKFLSRISKAMGEDRMHIPGEQGGDSSTALQRMYPSMSEKK